MSPKEYLSQIRLLTARLELVEANINRIREERITLRSAWPDGQPHGTITGDPTAQKAIELARVLKDYESRQVMLRSEIWSARMHIIETIMRIPDSECNRLLFLRYVDMLTWEEIAVRMQYTYQWVAGPLHSRALELVRELMKGESE